jgi:hypothetical protein
LWFLTVCINHNDGLHTAQFYSVIISNSSTHIGDLYQWSLVSFGVGREGHVGVMNDTVVVKLDVSVLEV